MGVFWRLAPSTKAIMRSRNASPGLAVTRTTSQSERTWVPPVTALRSPPLSRITGALSPVIAASFTDATPSMTSPSAGMKSPASTSTTSPFRSEVPGTRAWSAPWWGCRRRLACTSRRAFRRDAAWAFPRPSAMASAKLAKRTVNQSQIDTAKMKPAGASPFPTSAWSQSSVVKIDPTYTTNITGFRTWTRGASLRNESTVASRMIGQSNSGRSVVAPAMLTLLTGPRAG